jgi:hypothetical protein
MYADTPGLACNPRPRSAGLFSELYRARLRVIDGSCAHLQLQVPPPCHFEEMPPPRRHLCANTARPHKRRLWSTIVCVTGMLAGNVPGVHTNDAGGTRAAAGAPTGIGGVAADRPGGESDAQRWAGNFGANFGRSLSSIDNLAGGLKPLVRNLAAGNSSFISGVAVAAGVSALKRAMSSQAFDKLSLDFGQGAGVGGSQPNLGAQDRFFFPAVVKDGSSVPTSVPSQAAGDEPLVQVSNLP